MTIIERHRGAAAGAPGKRLPAGMLEAIKAEGIVDRKTLYRWRKTMEELTDSKYNYVPKSFVNDIVTNLDDQYELHFQQMYVNTSPLLQFLNISYLQL